MRLAALAHKAAECQVCGTKQQPYTPLHTRVPLCVMCRGRTPLQPFEVTPMRQVPAGIQRPPYADSGRLPGVDRRPQVHNAQVRPVQHTGRHLGHTRLSGTGAWLVKGLMAAGWVCAYGGQQVCGKAGTWLPSHAPWVTVSLSQFVGCLSLSAVALHPRAEGGVACALLLLQGVERMRAACKLAAQVLEQAGTLAKPGVTTDEIDQAVHDMIVAAGAYPSPLNYGKFPKSVCTSVNEVMCHGIPDKR